MKEILTYIEQILEIGLRDKKISGHDYFSGFPQPYKDKITKELSSLLYYAVELLIEINSDNNVKSWRYDYLRDLSLNDQPGGMGRDRTAHWNLWTVLKVIKKELK